MALRKWVLEKISMYHKACPNAVQVEKCQSKLHFSGNPIGRPRTDRIKVSEKWFPRDNSSRWLRIWAPLALIFYWLLRNERKSNLLQNAFLQETRFGELESDIHFANINITIVYWLNNSTLEKTLVQFELPHEITYRETLSEKLDFCWFRVGQ